MESLVKVLGASAEDQTKNKGKECLSHMFCHIELSEIDKVSAQQVLGAR
jgi:hypothetical protein